VAAHDWFQGAMSTAREADELLVETRLPVLAPDTRFGFQEFSRRAGDFGIAMALVTFRIEAGVMAEPRVGVGGAETLPRRIAEAEAQLAGRAPSKPAFQAAADAAAQALKPLTDVHYSADYRRDLVRTMVRRALEQA
jgi:carbon-monoxide dehydrogenase medium subunit